MKLLALDTSSLACSVALQVDDAVIWRHEEQAREHTRILVPMIEEVLAEAGVTTMDLEGIVLGNGPGSFIGMRIGTSVAQGLAHGAGIRIAPVSSMLAVAAQVIAKRTADLQRVDCTRTPALAFPCDLLQTCAPGVCRIPPRFDASPSHASVCL